SPPAIAATPLSPLTCTGVLLVVFVPLPNCPLTLYPQAQTVPSLFSGRPWHPPPAMSVTPLSPCIPPAVLSSLYVPLPSSPPPWYPHAHTLPSLFDSKLFVT